MIRDHYVVANVVVLHHVVSMTRVLQELIAAGYPVTPEIMARRSPYKTAPMTRFGHNERRFDQMPQSPSRNKPGQKIIDSCAD